MLDHVIGNPHFLYSSLYGFSSADTMSFFESLGVELVVERGRRVFPKSQKSEDILKAMERFLKQRKVDIRLNTEVKSVIIEKIKKINTAEGTIFAGNLIIATGGLSYPATGSTGDGFRFAKENGLKVIEAQPSLVPLRTAENWVSEVQGLTLKNITLELSNAGHTLFKGFGELLFTHFGVSGPLVLSASRFAVPNSTLSIDLKPALDLKTLNTRVLADFNLHKNRGFANALSDLLPHSLIPVIVRLSGIHSERKVHDITKAERLKLTDLLKSIKLTVTGNRGFKEAVITRGGVDVSQLNPSTMEYKNSKLYFVGEVLDVDALTGGYNLQIAFSTGYMAGMNC
jgi:predicted Rossmann fold flavoprotein